LGGSSTVKHCAACGVELEENETVVCWKCYKIKYEDYAVSQAIIKAYREKIKKLREEINRLKRYRDAIMKDPKFLKLWLEIMEKELSK